MKTIYMQLVLKSGAVITDSIKVDKSKYASAVKTLDEMSSNFNSATTLHFNYTNYRCDEVVAVCFTDKKSAFPKVQR